MPLVEIWKRSPDQLRGKTIQQILVFAGDGKLRDGNETSAEFRDYLAHVTSEDLSLYANQCLDTSFPDSGLALQDITNQVGKRLGFRVDAGRYRGTTRDVGFDGLWHSKGGEAILVEVKTTDAYRLSLDTGAGYRRELIKQGTILEENSSILYIVGRSDTGDLEAQVRGSRHAWDIRLISVEALLRLLRIKEDLEDAQTVDRIRDILMPQEFTKVDGIIDLVFSATKEIQKEIPGDPEAEPQETKREKKFTPVNFRAACVERLQKFVGDSLVKESPAIFATPDGKKAVLSSTSREYDRSNGTGYWFAFHPSQKDTLEQFETSWVTFGCGSENQILTIPTKEFVNWLPRFNRTELEDRYYWHIHIGKQHSQWTLDVKKGEQRIDVTPYFLK